MHMLKPNIQIDPLVQILCSAYRRGLALRQHQEEERKIFNVEHHEKTNTNPPPYKRVPPDTANQEA
jgi:hypothetical protein